MKHVNLILFILLGLAFLFFGVQKFTGPNPIFAKIALNSGIDLFEPVIRMLTGAGELTTGVLLLLPKTRKFGVLLGLPILIGAIGFHLSPWLGINVPEVGGHWLFFTAVGMLIVNLILFFRFRTI